MVFGQNSRKSEHSSTALRTFTIFWSPYNAQIFRTFEIFIEKSLHEPYCLAKENPIFD